MADVPYPLTASDQDELKGQVYELIRQLYEDRIGGADLGDVFSLPGDVLTLALAGTPGLKKTDNLLSVETSTAGGLQLAADGVGVKVLSTGGLEATSSGLGIKLNGATLNLSASGLSVAAPSGVLSGIDTLAAGSKIVTCASVTMVSMMFLTAQETNILTALRVSARNAGVDFTVESNSATDFGVFAWYKIEP